MEPYFRGKVFYVRAQEIGVERDDISILVDTDSKEINIDTLLYVTPDGGSKKSLGNNYISIMSPHQNNAYWSAVKMATERGPEIYKHESQASSLVFPDGTWGTGEEPRAEEDWDEPSGSGYKKYVEGRNLYDKRPSRALNDYFKGYSTGIGDALWNLSPKFYNICILVDTRKGVHYIYDESTEGSGLVMLGIFLEQLDYERYTGDSSIYAYKPGQVKKTLMERYITPRLRYAILTSDNRTKYPNITEAVSSIDNLDGERIKAVLVSRVAREGTNFSNILHEHIVSPLWTGAAEQQSLARGIRVGSHDNLIRREYQQHLEERREGDPLPSIEDVKVTVEIYRHASVPLPERGVNYMLRNYIWGRSIDLYMYDVARSKSEDIGKTMRFAKQCSATCQIHHRRNVRDTDTDFTESTDFQEAFYDCVDPEPEEEDYTTYDVYFADKEMEDVGRVISRYAIGRDSFTIEDFVRDHSNIRVKIVTMILEKILRERRPQKDRYGLPSYIQEDSGLFFLNRNYPTAISSYSSSYYSRNLVMIERRRVHALSEDIEKQGAERLLSTLSARHGNILTMIRDETQGIKTKLVEEAVISSIRGDSNPVVADILRAFRLVIHRIRKPKLSDIERPPKTQTLTRSRKGSRADAVTRSMEPLEPPIETTIVDYAPVKGGPEVYVHQLKALYGKANSENKTLYISGAGELRVLDPSIPPLEWRDVPERERELYRIYVHSAVNDIFRVHGKGTAGGDIYAFVVPTDGLFRIVNKRAEKEKKILKKGGGVRRDKKYDMKGRSMVGFNVEHLVEFIWYLRIPILPETSVFSKVAEGSLRTNYALLAADKLASYMLDKTWPAHQREATMFTEDYKAFMDDAMDRGVSEADANGDYIDMMMVVIEGSASWRGRGFPVDIGKLLIGMTVELYITKNAIANANAISKALTAYDGGGNTLELDRPLRVYHSFLWETREVANHKADLSDVVMTYMRENDLVIE